MVHAAYIIAILIFWAYHRVNRSYHRDQQREAISSLKTRQSIILNEEKLKGFRKGDQVYVTGSDNWNPSTPCYLLESYNGGTCWYVGLKDDDRTMRSVFNGFHISKLQRERPAHCDRCGQILKQS